MAKLTPDEISRKLTSENSFSVTELVSNGCGVFDTGTGEYIIYTPNSNIKITVNGKVDEKNPDIIHIVG